MAPFALTEQQSASVVEAYLRGEARAAIAARVGVHPNTVTRIVRRAGVEQRSARKRRLDGASRADVIMQYEAGVPTIDIAVGAGVSTQYISRVAIEAGADRRRPRRVRRATTLDDAEMGAVVEMYRVGASARSIAQVHGVTHATVLRYLERCGVPRRTPHAR